MRAAGYEKEDEEVVSQSGEDSATSETVKDETDVGPMRSEAWSGRLI